MTNFGITSLAPFFFDEQLNVYLYSIRNIFLVKFFYLITFLGEAKILIILGLFVLVFLWLTNRKWQGMVLWLIMVAGEGVTYFAKIFFNRPRPLNAIYFIESNSFPSGHAMISVLFYGFLAYLLHKNTSNRLCKYLIVSGTILLVLLIGFSRLYLGVHYFSDVVAGYIVGIFWLVIGIGLSKRKKQ